MSVVCESDSDNVGGCDVVARLQRQVERPETRRQIFRVWLGNSVAQQTMKTRRSSSRVWALFASSSKPL